MFSFQGSVESIPINDEDKDDLEIQFSTRKKVRKPFLERLCDKWNFSIESALVLPPGLPPEIK